MTLFLLYYSLKMFLIDVFAFLSFSLILYVALQYILICQEIKLALQALTLFPHSKGPLSEVGA